MGSDTPDQSYFGGPAAEIKWLDHHLAQAQPKNVRQCRGDLPNEEIMDPIAAMVSKDGAATEQYEERKST
jgi:hypothetical protein